MMNAGKIQMAGVLEHVQTEEKTREDGEVGEVLSRHEKVQVGCGEASFTWAAGTRRWRPIDALWTGPCLSLH